MTSETTYALVTKKNMKVYNKTAYLPIKVFLNCVWNNLNTFGSTKQSVINFHRFELLEIVILGLYTHLQQIMFYLIEYSNIL